MSDPTPEEIAAADAKNAAAAAEADAKRIADKAADAEKAAAQAVKDDAASAEKQAKSAQHVVLDATHGWYDDAGRFWHYLEGAVVTDYDAIRALLKRKAPVTAVPK